MGYLHIQNLYKDQNILAFRECYALEKVHGTSAHVGWSRVAGLTFFGGEVNHETFKALFDHVKLETTFQALGVESATVFGEAYGGRLMGMKARYGAVLRFIAFDVRVGEMWLPVPAAEQFVESAGLQFVPYEKGPTDLSWLDAQRDAPSTVSANLRLGCHPREGVVLRPLIEVTLNNGHRVIAKHKRQEDAERATPQKVVDPAALQVLADAQAIADEWVTPMRLTHVLSHLTVDGVVPTIKDARKVIDAMLDDVVREAAGEIVMSGAARGTIGKKTMELFKARVGAHGVT